MRIKYDAPIMNDEDKEINCYMRKKTKNDETTKINTDISNTFNCATEFNNNNNINLKSGNMQASYHLNTNSLTTSTSGLSSKPFFDKALDKKPFETTNLTNGAFKIAKLEKSENLSICSSHLIKDNNISIPNTTNNSNGIIDKNIKHNKFIPQNFSNYVLNDWNNSIINQNHQHTQLNTQKNKAMNHPLYVPANNNDNSNRENVINKNIISENKDISENKNLSIKDMNINKIKAENINSNIEIRPEIMEFTKIAIRSKVFML
mgnify:CR=1 FL=1